MDDNLLDKENESQNDKSELINKTINFSVKSKENKIINE